MTETVSVKECDYLDEDKPIRGQNYVCLSFLSPEEVLKDKEAFYFSEFVKSFTKDVNTLFDSLKLKYPDSASTIDVIRENNDYILDSDKIDDQYKFFKSVHSKDLEKTFLAKNNFRTSVRGIKVRGSYDTLEEAKIRAEVLKRSGNDRFDIFVGQVGCWCPFSPNPDDIADQEYAETQLNTLMKKYKENNEQKDAAFEQRKQDKLQKAAAELAASNNAVSVSSITEDLSKSTITEEVEPVQENEPVDSLIV